MTQSLRKPKLSTTYDLFSQEEGSDVSQSLTWPSSQRFPVNIAEYHVQDVILPDLYTSNNPLIVTGYAALDRIIDFCHTINTRNSQADIRLLIGQEPYPSRREVFTVNSGDLNSEAESYWLEQGISLIYSAKLIHMVELIKAGKVQTRYVKSRRRLHAKIYCGDDAVSVGSSNFTEPGFYNQLEANTRFERKRDSARFDDLKAIAENYWSLGVDYNSQLIALLEKLLQVVSWQEALARACAELLEGEWAEAYIRGDYLPGSGALWPSQKQGIAQALTILSTQGSVLIADATGAGKTKMGTYLIGALRDQIIRTGRLRQGKALMVCPPTAANTWNRESNLSGVAIDTYSHGIISNERTRDHEDTLDAVKRAQLLCIDEGHNFLNFKSQRTQNLLRNMADHVVIFTATPINKSANDLLRIADMLGADNLSDSVIEAFKRMLRVKNINRSLTNEEVDELRGEIKRFTVRRTKKQLNRLIDRAPDTYVDITGKPCRFPKHRAKVYSLEESAEDRHIAKQIQSLADELSGPSYFTKPIKLPEILAKQGVSEEKYLQGRLISARRLSRYLITSCLRSSRAALIEHIEGTLAAIEFADIPNFQKGQHSRGMIGQIDRMHDLLPENHLAIALPDWLVDRNIHRSVCAHDIEIYKSIAALVRKLKPHREQVKARHLAKLLNKHSLILAFDSKPVTLAIMQKILQATTAAEVIAAWGSSPRERDLIITKFAFGSTEKNIIGLCSDSLAEAVNLQQASCLVHLDMPSVVRIAEQRVGRIDRMDSPHREIEIWWPEDSEEFALTSDERFIERFDTVEKLLGSNMPLPDSLRHHSRKAISVHELISEAEEEETKWDGIDDAFSPVRSLIEGDNAIVPADIYERYRLVTERVLSRVSVVKSKTSWALFCVATGSFDSPIWVFFPSVNASPETEFGRIAKSVRARLGDDVEDSSLDGQSAEILRRFLGQLRNSEKVLLSRKKQRALTEMSLIIDNLARREECKFLVDDLLQISNMVSNPLLERQPDWDEVASLWLDLIRPVWFENLKGPRKKPLLLKDIRQALLVKPVDLAKKIIEHFAEFPVLVSLDRRIKACIVGIATR